MGLIGWDGIYGESDTFLSDAEVAAATEDADAQLRERPHRELTADLPDLDDARRRKQQRSTPRPAG